jgi:uncharacterized protein (TIGR00255 family)
MLLSMTGYGTATVELDNFHVQVEVKSLNSKTTDIRCKIPSGLSEKELSFRKIIMEGALRGRLEATLKIISQEGTPENGFNPELFKEYYRSLNSICHELNIKNADIVNAVMRIPNVVSAPEIDFSEDQWEKVVGAIHQALKNLQSYRIEEGIPMANDLYARVKLIKNMLSEIEPFEIQRTQRVKEKLKKNLEDSFPIDKVDMNRYEQEILYYLEKLDITEEKVRLSQHCDYFLDQLHNEEKSVGKILSFITQEMGREINTLGAKAQDSEMQQFIVKMKDELEKIKEQLANIL